MFKNVLDRRKQALELAVCMPQNKIEPACFTIFMPECFHLVQLRCLSSLELLTQRFIRLSWISIVWTQDKERPHPEAGFTNSNQVGNGNHPQYYSRLPSAAAAPQNHTGSGEVWNLMKA
jgi:hypothetical protein